MTAYRVKIEDVPIAGGEFLRIRSLLDRMQFHDPDDEALSLGISSASWPLFGLLWPSGRVLADAMQTFDLQDMRILEIGCGLALPSLVAHRRRADVTASDRHPLAEAFLRENLRLNALPPMTYTAGNWAGLSPALGRFDMIVGSDILYERDQPEQLMAFIDAHGARGVKIMIVDPNRGNRASFSRAMAVQGFGHVAERVQRPQGEGRPYRGQLLSYRRSG